MEQRILGAELSTTKISENTQELIVIGNFKYKELYKCLNQSSINLKSIMFNSPSDCPKDLYHKTFSEAKVIYCKEYFESIDKFTKLEILSCNSVGSKVQNLLIFECAYIEHDVQCSILRICFNLMFEIKTSIKIKAVIIEFYDYDDYFNYEFTELTVKTLQKSGAEFKFINCSKKFINMITKKI